MARRSEKLTDKGKAFIKQIVNNKGNSLLSGSNGPLPYSDNGSGNLVNKNWSVNAKFNGKDLTKDNLSDALITWFNKYSDEYELDPNILAAQAYIESEFKLWWYDNGNTTKSGINGFTMSMVYSVIIDNFTNILPKMSINDISNLNNNLISAASPTSYQPLTGNENTKEIARKNRGLLHQNIINSPETMIKAQARYMRYLSNNCDNLASTSLFCYRKGTKYMANTYSRAIQKYKKDLSINDNTNPKLKEGLNYVLKIFGVLGDENNLLKPFNDYKPKGYSFGYNNNKTEIIDGEEITHQGIFKFNGKSDLIDENGNSMYPNKNFNPFEANKKESEQYNIEEETLDNLSIVRDKKYKFIYFPESRYVREETKKIQIVLHHTVSGGNDDVAGDIKFWRDKGERVATPFIISRTGRILQLFNSDFWAYHLGLRNEYLNELDVQGTNLFLNSRSIGIELDSWGGLLWGESDEGEGWFPTAMDNDGDIQIFNPLKGSKPIPEENVQEYNSSNGYPQGYRGFKAFEKYTSNQIQAAMKLILSLQEKFTDIKLEFNEDMWDINYDAQIKSPDGAWGISKNALNGVSGIWTHTSYRNDKSDCHPQPDLIENLRNLNR